MKEKNKAPHYWLRSYSDTRIRLSLFLLLFIFIEKHNKVEIYQNIEWVIDIMMVAIVVGGFLICTVLRLEQYGMKRPPPFKLFS
ncbi:hypothetical protein [Chryseobacterium nematophagum]|nr:hypothetical protein [Chryseobacterium nematophagum]